MASIARCTSTSFTDPDALQPLLNCSLIALDKNPGVQPIGIGETSRRIIAKAVLQVVKQDVLDLAGCLQLCAGQCAGCEAAVHAMRMIFGDEDTEGVMLVDASNAFNSLNRRVTLLNMFQLCPPLATIPVLEITVGHRTFSDQIWALSDHLTNCLDKMSDQFFKNS